MSFPGDLPKNYLGGLFLPKIRTRPDHADRDIKTLLGSPIKKAQNEFKTRLVLPAS